MLRSLVVAALLISPIALADSKFKLEGNQLVLPGPIYFETGSAKIKSESAPVLDHIKAYLDDKTYITTLRIENHTDSAGSEKYNQKLSGERALAVAKALVGKGVDCKRLLPVGFGETKPVAGNDTPEGRAANRRTSFVNAGLRGKAIGGMPLDGGGKVAGDPCK